MEGLGFGTQSQLELFSRLGRDAPAPALLAAIRVGWANTRRIAAAAFANVQDGDARPSTPLGGVGGINLPMYKYVHRSRQFGTSAEHGIMQAPPPPEPSNTSPTFVHTLATEIDLDPVSGPILRGAAAVLGRLVDWYGAPVIDPTRTLKGGTFLVRNGLLYRRGQGAADRLCFPASGPASGGLRAQVLRAQERLPLRLHGWHFGRAKTGSLVRCIAFSVS